MSDVRTYPSPVRERESGESGLVFGLNIGALFGIYDPDLQLWKTLERSLFEDLPMFWDRLPKSGMMRNGRIYEQKTWVLRTKGKEYGLWPTPSASQARSEGMIKQMRAKVDAGELSRVEAEAMIAGSMEPARMNKWPTPAASMWKGTGPQGSQSQQYDNRTSRLKGQDRLYENGATGQLNPQWVDWLMGYPAGWTDLKDSAMQLSLK